MISISLKELVSRTSLSLYYLILSKAAKFYNVIKKFKDLAYNLLNILILFFLYIAS